MLGKDFNSFNKDEVLILATAYLEGSVNLYMPWNIIYRVELIKGNLNESK